MKKMLFQMVEMTSYYISFQVLTNQYYAKTWANFFHLEWLYYGKTQN